VAVNAFASRRPPPRFDRWLATTARASSFLITSAYVWLVVGAATAL